MDTSDDGTSFRPPQPAAPAPSGPPSLPPPGSAYNSTPMPPPPPGAGLHPFVPAVGEPTAVVVPVGSAGKRNKGKVFGGLVAVVALVGAGGFAVSKIVAGDDGGAASPTEVGTRLMDALGSEDALGVVDLLLPGERDMMRRPLIDLVDNLKRLEVVDGSASLNKVGGLDISFDDVQVDPTATNVNDVSDIRITATGTASVDGATVPIGNLLIDEAFGGQRPKIADTEPQSGDVDVRLATVKHGGRWYLSAFYSIAENARRAGDDIPETGVVAHGADTPEGAVQAIFDAVGNLDIEALIAALNPNEAEALQRYAPMFIDDAQKSLDDANAKIAFSDTKYSVSGTGDRRTVTVDGFTMSAGADGNEVKVVDEGGCVVMTSGDTTTNTCKGGSSADGALTALGVNENDDVKALIKTVQDAFADVGPTGITVQKVNGQWFVSPIGSIADLLLTELAALDKNELTDIIDGVKKVSQSVLSGDIFGGDTTAAGSDGGDTSAGSGSNSDTSGLDTCFAETDYPAYSACIGAGLADGTIDPAFVAPYYRFVECGVGEQYWKGDVYSMSDEDFTAFALAAAPCFQKYISDGTISQFELPYELSRPDCLEGRNWYNVTDEAYTNRVFECAG